MDRVCSHCDKIAAASDARNEKTSAGISADGVCGRMQLLIKTARLRPTNAIEDICMHRQLVRQWFTLRVLSWAWKEELDRH